ncbi:MAG: DUF4352 domain-containing protein [Gemmatimonadota bacterium]|nr:DUF4352 domain-containing protein [Gemmatimonadota bacterium]
MMIFELLFVAVVLGSVVTLASAAVTALRGRRQRALALVVGWATCIAVYLGVVVAVALVSPQRTIALGEDRCFDDWCVAVSHVTLTHEMGAGVDAIRTNGQFYVVTIRLSNHARGRSQRASSAAVRLADGEGRVYEVSREGQAAYEAQHGPASPLTSTMDIGQAIDAVRVFELPTDSRDVGLTVEHPVGPAPGLFIIGDDASLFHKPTVMRLN